MGGLFPTGLARFLAMLLSTVLSFFSILAMLVASPEGLVTGVAVGVEVLEMNQIKKNNQQRSKKKKKKLIKDKKK